VIIKSRVVTHQLSNRYVESIRDTAVKVDFHDLVQVVHNGFNKDFNILQKVCKQVTHFVKLSSAMILGGSKVKPQKKSLKYHLDVLVATPGRLLQHRKNGLFHAFCFEKQMFSFLYLVWFFLEVGWC